MGKLKQLFCKHKETEVFEGDWVKYHWVDEETPAFRKGEGDVTYELREGRNVQTTCKRCGKKWVVFESNVLDSNLTDFSLFGKVEFKNA